MKKWEVKDIDGDTFEVSAERFETKAFLVFYKGDEIVAYFLQWANFRLIDESL